MHKNKVNHTNLQGWYLHVNIPMNHGFYFLDIDEF